MRNVDLLHQLELVKNNLKSYYSAPNTDDIVMVRRADLHDDIYNLDRLISETRKDMGNDSPGV